MTKHLDVAGTTYNDIVTWRWERSRMRWVSTLSDGTELVVALQRFGRRSFWNPSVNGKALPNNGFHDPEAAQHAAFVAWQTRVPVKLADIASKIRAHLKRFEADPKINTKRRGLSRYYGAGAHASGARVGMRYIAFQGVTYVSKADALRYLAWLDAGNVGRHFEALRE
jgi:hypothetical protein